MLADYRQRNTDPTTGKPLPYQQRRDARLRADRQRRMDERQAEAQAKADAAANPPEPETQHSFNQRAAMRLAEENGKAEARKRQAELAAENAPPKNSYRELAKQIEGQRFIPSVERRYQRFMARADELDRERAAEAEQAAKQAAIDSSPAVILARESAGYLVKMAPTPELAALASECAGIAAAGDSGLYWLRAKECETKILDWHDQQAAEKRAAKSATDAEYEAAAAAAQATKARLDHAEVVVAELSE
jgi:hypothetical protein